MSITFPLSSGWSESFAGTTTTSPAFNWGSGANRKAYAIACYQGGVSIKPVPNTLVIGGTDTLTAVGGIYNEPTTSDKFQFYEGDLTVSGSQTAVQTFTSGAGVSSGAAQIAVLVAQGGGALTRANLLALLAQSAPGGGGGNLSRVVTSAVGDKVVQVWVNNSGVVPTAVSPATLLTNSPSYAGANNFHDTASGTSTTIASAWGSFGGGINAAFTLSEPGAAPTATLSGALDTITGNLVAGAAAIVADLNGALDAITGNLTVGGSTGRLTSALPLRDATRVVLPNRSDLAVLVMAKPGLAPVNLLTAQSVVSGIWTSAGPYAVGSRYNVVYEVAGEPIGCEIITATAP